MFKRKNSFQSATTRKDLDSQKHTVNVSILFIRTTINPKTNEMTFVDKDTQLKPIDRKFKCKIRSGCPAIRFNEIITKIIANVCWVGRRTGIWRETIFNNYLFV